MLPSRRVGSHFGARAAVLALPTKLFTATTLDLAKSTTTKLPWDCAAQDLQHNFAAIFPASQNQKHLSNCLPILLFSVFDIDVSMHIRIPLTLDLSLMTDASDAHISDPWCVVYSLGAALHDLPLPVCMHGQLAYRRALAPHTVGLLDRLDRIAPSIPWPVVTTRSYSVLDRKAQFSRGIWIAHVRCRWVSRWAEPESNWLDLWTCYVFQSQFLSETLCFSTSSSLKEAIVVSPICHMNWSLSLGSPCMDQTEWSFGGCCDLSAVFFDWAMAESGATTGGMASAPDEKSITLIASSIRSELRSLRDTRKVEREQQLKVQTLATFFEMIFSLDRVDFFASHDPTWILFQTG